MNESERLLAEIVRVGTVMDVKAEKKAARVLFRDRQNMVSDLLPLLLPYNGGSEEMPKVGDMGICLFLPFDSRGVILGKYTKGGDDG